MQPMIWRKDASVLAYERLEDLAVQQILEKNNPYQQALDYA